MKQPLSFRLPVCFLMIVVITPTLAQHSTAADCLGALSKDYYSYSDDHHLELDWLRSIDQETYESAKKDNSFSLLGMFSGAVFDLKDTYSQFDEKRAKYLEVNHYTRNESDAKQIVAMTTSDRAYSAYEACLRTIGSGGGVLVWATRTSMNKIDLVVRYANPPGRPSARLYGIVEGGKVTGQPKGQLWKSGLRWGTMQEKPFTVIPDPGEAATTVRVQDEFGSPVTAVTFERADGTMTLQYIGTTPVERVKGFVAIGPLSPNNDHNKGGCANYVGRDQGGYCKSGTTVTFSVAAPRFLKDAQGGVIGSGGPWSEQWQPATISTDGLTATYGRANWGSPINPTLTVDIWEHLSAAQCGEASEVPALLEQQVVFDVPKECIPIATIQWKTFRKNSSGVVPVGQSSPAGEDGAVAAAPINSGDYLLVGYKIRRSSNEGSEKTAMVQ